jgi:DNA-binding MarR family transcriptional regulator
VNEFELSDQLLACVTKIRRTLDERLAPFGLSVARKRVLGALATGPVRQGDLATAFEVTPRTITELVDGLERDGFAERRGDPADRRVRIVHITEAGRQANEQAMAARAEVIKQIFADLSGQDRHTLIRMLTAINKRASAMSAAAGEGIPLGSRWMAISRE